MLNFISIIIFLVLFLSVESHAYIGLGPLIPIIGSSIVFLFGVIVAIVGFISYPGIKIYKFLKKRKLENSKKK
jgi:membrane protein YdbS with pleckstrin-like domain